MQKKIFTNSTPCSKWSNEGTYTSGVSYNFTVCDLDLEGDTIWNVMEYTEDEPNIL